MTVSILLRRGTAIGKRLRTVILGLAPTNARSLFALVALLLVLLGSAAAHVAGSRKARAYSSVYTVTATAYEAVATQTDSKPFITADNSRIPRGYGSHTRWLALSRDLLKPWGGPFEFGDKLRVQGISPALDGVYTVHDTMNRRYRHRLDVLAHPREHVSILRPGVKIQRVSAPQHHTNSPAVARKATTKPVLAHRHTAPRIVVHSRARSQSRVRHVAAAPHHSPRSAKRRPVVAHHQHGVTKQRLAVLPKHSKKRVAARRQHRPTA